MTRTTQATHRAIAQTWADKVQHLEEENEALKTENQRLLALLQLTFNDVIQTCNAVLKEAKK